MAVIVGQGISVSPVADAELSHESTSTVQNKVVTDAIASEYSTSKTYSVGDVCTHDGKLYECIVDIPTAEGWTLSHWKVSNIGDNVSNLNHQLSDETTGLDTKAPVILETASGAIASFDDGADSMPIKSLVAQIEPVQDLHGYDSPWPAGGGANKFGGDALKTALLTVTGATEGSDANGNYVNLPASGALNNVILFSDFEENQQYTIIFKILPTGSHASNIRVYYTDNTAQTFSTSGDGQLETVSYTTAAGKTVESIRLGYWYTSTCKVYYDSCGVFVGADQTFAPYENLCPISGHTGAEIEQTGVNVWDEEWEVGSIYEDGTDNNNRNDVIRTKGYISVKPGESYYYNVPQSYYFVYDSNKTFIKILYMSEKAVITIPINGYYLRFRLYPSYGTTYNHDISINYPATDTTYHPYTGNQISVNWQTEAGTIYGGTVTLNPDRTGTLVTGRASIMISDTELSGTGYSYAENDDFFYGYVRMENSPIKIGGIFSSVKSGAPNITIHDTATVYPSRIIRLNISALERTASAYLAWLHENPLQCVYEIEPQTIQLTAAEVSGFLSTLYGHNNIWSSTGDVEVTYPADTKLYIDGKITQAIANALNS